MQTSSPTQNNPPNYDKLRYYSLTITQQLNLILYKAAKNNQLSSEQQEEFSVALGNAISTFQSDETANKSPEVFALAAGEEDENNTAEDENNTGEYALLRTLMYTEDTDLVPDSRAWWLGSHNKTLFKKILSDNNEENPPINKRPIGFQIAEGFDVVLHPYPEEEDYKNHFFSTPPTSLSSRSYSLTERPPPPQIQLNLRSKNYL